MTLTAPFPWFGGKRRAAPLIWDAFGDPSGYVEPFAGSAAVLLARPPYTGRRVETINDLDGWLVNTWRAIRNHPDQVAHHAYGPVTEIDYHARLAWLQARRDGLVSWLEGDPDVCDAKAAGWWLYVVACGIGNPFDPGPWLVVDGHLTRTTGRTDGTRRENPHLGSAGKGINRELPHLGNAGKGINRELPHLGNAGKGINRETDLHHYMHQLAQRLARVRITCGPWQRVLTPIASRAGTGGDGTRAILLDPPYTTSGDLYHDGDATGGLSRDVREWCTTHADPDTRIVLCGYDTEHDALLDDGWTKRVGKAGGAGYSSDPLNHRRERLWLSPACRGVTHEQHAFTFDDEERPA